MVRCGRDTARELSCRDGRAASHLKLISVCVIFFTSVVGVSLPVILARVFHGKPVYDRVVLLIKCFAAGVILSTSLVHVLPDAFDALSDCQVSSLHPWKDFPFSGLVVLIGSLLALSVDVVAKSHVDAHHHHHHQSDNTKMMTMEKPMSEYAPVGTQEEMVISCCEKKKKMTVVEVEAGGVTGGGGGATREEMDQLVKLKQRLVSQVLEIGIIFHSVIIGVTVGMSQNKCTIRPLVLALAFHQIFEGMGLGGCIAQAGFSIGTTAYMCLMFSLTTPMGIILGMVVFSVTGYDDSSVHALILEGLLGSLSSGILIYMALVDLIAVDFFHNKMMTTYHDSATPWLKTASYISLLLGSTSMSILALWA